MLVFGTGNYCSHFATSMRMTKMETILVYLHAAGYCLVYSEMLTMLDTGVNCKRKVLE